jgi:hypothetical protein
MVESANREQPEDREVNLLLMGPVEPLVFQALMSELSEGVTVRRSCAKGARLLSEGLRQGALAIVTSRDDAEIVCRHAPASILVVGISSGSWDVLVSRHGTRQYLNNPRTEILDHLIREVLPP